MLFFDSCFMIGLFIKTDNFYEKSHHLLKMIKKEKVLINNTVVNEVLNSFKNTKNDVKLNKITNYLFNEIQTDYLTEDDYKKALDYYNYYNTSINFSDCTVLVTMNKYNIDKIVSFDSDFNKIKGIKRIYL